MNTGFISDSDSLAAGTDTSTPVTENVDVAVDGIVDRDDSSGKFDGVWTIVQDGTAASSNNVSLGSNFTFNRDFDGTVTLGRHTQWGNLSTVNIKYLQLAKVALPTDYVVLKQNNYKTPSSFWTTGTPQDTPSGGTTEIISFNEAQNLTIDTTENTNKIAELTESQQLSIDADSSLSTIKNLEEILGLTVSQYDMYQTIRSFAETFNISVSTAEVLNKIVGFVGTQATGLSVTGTFSKAENGLTEFNGTLPLNVGLGGTFQKIAELNQSNNLTITTVDAVVSIKTLQEIQEVESNLNGTQRKVVLLDTPLQMTLNVEPTYEKYSTFSEQSSLTINTYGIVYDAINDADKVEAIVATVQGELVVIQVTGLLFESVIEGTITENKINGIILNN